MIELAGGAGNNHSERGNAQLRSQSTQCVSCRPGMGWLKRRTPMEAASIQRQDPTRGARRRRASRAGGGGNRPIPAARPGGLRDDHVRALDVQLEPRRRKGPAGRAGPGAGLWRDRAAARRHVGVPHRQHLRRGGVLLLRRLLDLVLGAERLLRQGDRRQRRPRDRRVPVGVGDLHRLHDGRRAARRAGRCCWCSCC